MRDALQVNRYSMPNPYAAAFGMAIADDQREVVHQPCMESDRRSTIVVIATAKRWPRDPAIPLAVVLPCIRAHHGGFGCKSKELCIRYDDALCAIAAERDAAGRFFSSWQMLLLAAISIMRGVSAFSCMPATFGHFGSYHGQIGEN